MTFKPNDLQDYQIDGLEDWQLLVAACHYGPAMEDCRTGNYEYTLNDGEVFLIQEGGSGRISLKGDIDIDDPNGTLERYASVTWRDLAKAALSKGMKDWNE